MTLGTASGFPDTVEEGDVEQFTGLQVKTSKDNMTISIGQKPYIENMFEKYCSGENSKLWTSPVGSRQPIRFDSACNCQWVFSDRVE